MNRQKVDTEKLSELLIYKLDDIIDYFKIDLLDETTTYSGRCPIHGGDNNCAFHINKDNHEYPGKFICYTHHCEREFMPTIIGFVRAMLSVKHRCWSAPGDKKVTFDQTINWCKKLLNIDNLAHIDDKEIERRRFIRENGCDPHENVPASKVGITRKDVLKHLDIPAKPFIERGYPENLLKRYDIGTYKYQKKYMSNRVVVPLYDKTRNIVEGFTARSIFPQCSKCNRYHDQSKSCPNFSNKLEFMKSAKWINKDFDKSTYLFNLWESIDFIRENKYVILCEGVGDVLKLEQYNIKGAVALFGNSLSHKQSILLDSLGVLKIILLLDNDKAGIEGRENIIKSYKRYYNIVVPNIDFGGKDIGDASEEQLNILKGFINDK